MPCCASLLFGATATSFTFSSLPKPYNEGHLPSLSRSNAQSQNTPNKAFKNYRLLRPFTKTPANALASDNTTWKQIRTNPYTVYRTHTPHQSPPSPHHLHITSHHPKPLQSQARLIIMSSAPIAIRGLGGRFHRPPPLHHALLHRCSRRCRIPTHHLRPGFRQRALLRPR